MVLSLAPGIDNGHWRYFLLASLTIQWVVLLTLGLLYLVRHELGRRRPIQIAYAALVMLVVSTLLVAGAAALLNSEAWVLMRADPRLTLMRLLLASLTAGTFALFVFRTYWTSRQLALQSKQSQVEALQARIQPHFLFNTLNTAVALVRAKPDAAEAVLLDLADLFREALDTPREVPLEHELAITRRYLDIEKLRLGDRLRLQWRVPDRLPSTLIPSLSIQPLAENAVRHGVEPSATGGDVDIRVEEVAGRVRISVTNTLPAAPGDHHGHHIGLAFARERITASGANDADFDVSIEGGRHIVTIELPSLDQPTTR